jgi:Fic family protein
VTPSANHPYPAVCATLAPQLARIDDMRARIDAKKGRDAALWNTLVERLRTDWTYHSNGIEGSALSRGETHFFLSEGLTAQGKPFKDFLDAQNHAEAIDMLFDVVADKLPITESLLKDINALILRGVDFTPAKNAYGHRVHKPAHPGRYKQQANHVEQADGVIHHYVDPVHVTDEMKILIAWIAEQHCQESVKTSSVHPVHVAAVAHYNLVRIHPFDDGNGRGARILMNLILMHGGYFPAVIRIETKPEYLTALGRADRGDLAPFVAYVADAVVATQQSVLDVLERQI